MKRQLFTGVHLALSIFSAFLPASAFAEPEQIISVPIDVSQVGVEFNGIRSWFIAPNNNGCSIFYISMDGASSELYRTVLAARLAKQPLTRIDYTGPKDGSCLVSRLGI